MGRRVRLGARSGLAGLGEFIGLWGRPVPGAWAWGTAQSVRAPEQGSGVGTGRAGLHLKLHLREQGRELFTVSRS